MFTEVHSYGMCIHMRFAFIWDVHSHEICIHMGCSYELQRIFLCGMHSHEICIHMKCIDLTCIHMGCSDSFNDGMHMGCSEYVQCNAFIWDTFICDSFMWAAVIVFDGMHICGM